MAKEEGVLRKHMSAFRGAKKGSLVDHVGSEVGPMAPSSKPNTYRQISVKSVRGKKR